MGGGCESIWKRSSVDDEVNEVSRFVMLPNKPYWAVVAIPKDPHKKEFIIMMALLKSDCEKWAEEQQYANNEFIIKRVWALINVAN